MKSLFVAFYLLLTFHTVAFATDSLSLALQSQDLLHLRIGDPTTIDVAVSGLPAGASLDYLAATVTFDGELLGTPIITAGSSVPDATGFTSVAQPGVADALYDSLAAESGMSINQPGVLLSFIVTPLVSGTGELTFSFVDALGSSPDGMIDGILAGAPIPFVVEVPEPAMMSLTAAVLAIASGCLRLRSAY